MSYLLGNLYYLELSGIKEISSFNTETLSCKIAGIIGDKFDPLSMWILKMSKNGSIHPIWLCSSNRGCRR
jgi:hypothetical protein